MSAFFITPYLPSEWESASSELMIDPETYREKLLERFPETEFLEPDESMLLEWSLYEINSEGVRMPLGMGALHADHQVLSMNTPVEEFFQWHREIIDAEHRLYLSEGGSGTSVELEKGVTLEEIETFLGTRSNRE
jgi:hypothetical protein